MKEIKELIPPPTLHTHRWKTEILPSNVNFFSFKLGSLLSFLVLRVGQTGLADCFVKSDLAFLTLVVPSTKWAGHPHVQCPAGSTQDFTGGGHLATNGHQGPPYIGRQGQGLAAGSAVKP